MLQRIIFFVLPFFISVVGFSQKVLVNIYLENRVARPNGDTIYYDGKKKLTWKDFQGKPDFQSPGGAITSSGYAFDADMKMEGKIIYLNVGVYVYFLKSESWRKTTINSDFHLLHEQLHFDITRLGAENFIKQIVKSTFTKDNFNEVLSSVFDRSYKENIALQTQYDDETQHSIKYQVQLKWNDKIAAEIKKL